MSEKNITRNTDDYIFMLSLSDMENQQFGFQANGSKIKCDQARVAKETDYARSQGVFTDYEDMGVWWLTSSGDFGDKAVVHNSGSCGFLGIFPNHDGTGVRPALHLNLSSSVWKKGSEVTSHDEKTKLTNFLPSGDSSGSAGGSGNNNGGSSPNGNNSGTSTQSSGSNTTSQTPTSDKANSNIGNTTLPIANNLLSGSNLANNTSDVSSSTTTSTTASAKSQLSKVKKIKAVNKKGKKLSLSWKKVKNATGYQIKYTTDKKRMKKLKYKTVSKNKATLSKLKKKTYYIQIRAMKTQNSATTFGEWSTVKKVKVKE